MANAKLSKVKVPIGSNSSVVYDIVPMGIHYLTGTGTAAITSSPYTFAKWDATCDAITELYDGLIIAYKVPVAGHASRGTCLQINTLGYHPVICAKNSMIGTRYAVDSMILLVYNSTIEGTVYNNSASSSKITGCWVVVNDQDLNNQVIQRPASTTAAAYPLLLSSVTNPAATTTSVIDKSSMTYNPSNSTLSVTAIQVSTINGVSVPATPAFTDTHNLSGSGTSGYLVKWSGATAVTNGPQLGTGTTTFLRNDGTWATPSAAVVWGTF